VEARGEESIGLDCLDYIGVHNYSNSVLYYFGPLDLALSVPVDSMLCMHACKGTGTNALNGRFLTF